MTRFQSEESGFSLAELVIATGLLLVVSAIVTNGLVQMTNQQQTIWNRTEMHSGIRGATELMQQEVSQAGRVALPGSTGTATLGSAITGGGSTCSSQTVTVNSTSGMFVGESLTTLDGDAQESAVVTAVLSATQFQACYLRNHASGAIITPLGAFATGIVPNTGIADGSDGTHLKMYGDINSDGNMVFVEYTCDTNAGNLYRNVMAYDAASKPAVTNSQILLSNITVNPDNTECFTYQTSTVTVNGTPFTFVLDVAVTLTVKTQQIDPVTRDYQTETKALLNVSPRNVFDAWMLAGIGYTDRIQSTPVSVTTLLPPPS